MAKAEMALAVAVPDDPMAIEYAPLAVEFPSARKPPEVCPEIGVIFPRGTYLLLQLVEIGGAMFSNEDPSVCCWINPCPLSIDVAAATVITGLPKTVRLPFVTETLSLSKFAVPWGGGLVADKFSGTSI